jgi:hypothetical protein
VHPFVCIRSDFIHIVNVSGFEDMQEVEAEQEEESTCGKA